MGLNSSEESIQRVTYRVRNGGHNVSEDSIRYNYEFGNKNLYKYVTAFDSVILYDNAITSIDEPVIPKEVLRIEKGKLYLQLEEYPSWAPLILSHPVLSIALLPFCLPRLS